MLSRGSVQAGGQASCSACRKVGLHRRQQGGEVSPADVQAEGLGTPELAGSGLLLETQLPARTWAVERLWAGCECQTPPVESLGREVIRNSCTSRWFILTF